MYKLMTPGPTMVSENVMKARSLPFTNPDVDLDFVEYYKETCDLISSFFETKNETLILSGEGILGLEAACATLTEPGDRVLVIDNGIYGKGFADFVELYDGIPTLYSCNYQETIDVVKLAKYLENNHDFKYATVVHCDTPSGMKNEIKDICPLLKKYGILTVVDSVSAMFGEEVKVDEYGIDILCGGSQKAMSAPPGLTFVIVSTAAKKIFSERKTKVHSFFANLNIFKNYYEDKWFPYTMPISDIYGLRQAMDNIIEDNNIIARHKKIAEAVRETLTNSGLELYLKSGFCNTVTVFNVPKETTAEAILSGMRKRNILLSGSFDIFAGKVIRIGHMGYSANYKDVYETLCALDEVLREEKVELRDNLGERFKKLWEV